MNLRFGGDLVLIGCSYLGDKKIIVFDSNGGSKIIYGSLDDCERWNRLSLNNNIGELKGLFSCEQVDKLRALFT